MLLNAPYMPVIDVGIAGSSRSHAENVLAKRYNMKSTAHNKPEEALLSRHVVIIWPVYAYFVECKVLH